MSTKPANGLEIGRVNFRVPVKPEDKVYSSEADGESTTAQVAGEVNLQPVVRCGCCCCSCPPFNLQAGSQAAQLR